VSGIEGRERHEVHYRGRVQGVGFRYTTRQIAARFNVTGFVRNLPDGRVLLVAEGPSEELGRFRAALLAAMGRYIDDEQESVGPATGQFYHHFEIRH